MRFVQSGTAVSVELQAVLVAAGDADASAGNIECAVRKWQQGDGEDGYYYTGTACNQAPLR